MPDLLGLEALPPGKGLGMGGHHRTKGGSVDWLTPPEIVRALGPFDLDPAASCTQTHGSTPPCAKHNYCRCQSGLGKPWDGFVWLNPPYGPQEIGRWMARLAIHGDGIALVFARTDTGWFQDLVFPTAWALFFVGRRIAFLRPDHSRGPQKDSGAPSVFIAYGETARLKLRLLPMRGKYIELRRS